MQYIHNRNRFDPAPVRPALRQRLITEGSSLPNKPAPGRPPHWSSHGIIGWWGNVDLLRCATWTAPHIVVGQISRAYSLLYTPSWQVDTGDLFGRETTQSIPADQQLNLDEPCFNSAFDVPWLLLSVVNWGQESNLTRLCFQTCHRSNNK